jgi:hypothetical protein
MLRFALIVALASTLGACSSVPKPPSCDGAYKRPVNKGATTPGHMAATVNPASYRNCA